MRAARIVLTGGGILLLGGGGWLLLSRQDPGQLLGVAIWLVAVVVVHDGTLAAASLVRPRLRRSAARREPDERPR